jgi:hypothetical protein
MIIFAIGREIFHGRSSPSLTFVKCSDFDFPPHLLTGVPTVDKAEGGLLL